MILSTHVPDGEASDVCSDDKTAEARYASGFLLMRPVDVLAVELPNGGRHFYKSNSNPYMDGWGNPTTDVIEYSDGTWQVTIPTGTVIELDGEWHGRTWLEIDKEGNPTFSYGYDGHITAEEIGLSNPITITKVS